MGWKTMAQTLLRKRGKGITVKKKKLKKAEKNP
jgi:hypothetical protein